MPGHAWPLHGAIGLQVNPFLQVVVAKNANLFFRLNLAYFILLLPVKLGRVVAVQWLNGRLLRLLRFPHW